MNSLSTVHLRQYFEPGQTASYVTTDFQPVSRDSRSRQSKQTTSTSEANQANVRRSTQSYLGPSNNELVKSLLAQQQEVYVQFLDERMTKLERFIQKQLASYSDDLWHGHYAQATGAELDKAKECKTGVLRQPDSGPAKHHKAEAGSGIIHKHPQTSFGYVIDMDDALRHSCRCSQSSQDSATLPTSEEMITETSMPKMDFAIRPEWEPPQAEMDTTRTTGAAYGRKTTQPAIMHRLSEASKEDASVRQGRVAFRALTGIPQFDQCAHACTWFLHKTVILPQSPLHVFWEVAGVLIVLFDMFELPLQVFDPPDSKFVATMRRVAQLFWNADLLVSFRMGYIANEGMIVKPGKVAVHYLRTWFLFDLIIVSLDWIMLIYEKEAQSPFFAKAGKVFKVFRTVRTVKMVRMLRMRGAFHAVEDHMVHLFSGCHTPVVGIFKFLLAIMLVCHFLCSVWYLVGDGAGALGWVDRFDVNQRPFWDKYLMTFHWALTQFGVGESQLQGETATEYICSIAILISGLVFTALLVSSVTNTFSILQQQTADQFHQMWLLRRFCIENEFPRSLSKRIQQHVEQHVNAHHARLVIGDIKLLGKLSTPLHAQVMLHIYLRPLRTHPFLKVLCRDDSYTMRAVATHALEELSLARNDLVFVRGAKAECCYNVIAGQMLYEHAMTEDAAAETISHSRWISEPMLWTSWLRCGDLYATTAVRLMTMEVEQFIAAVCAHADTYLLVQSYAQARVEELQGLQPEEISDVMSIDEEYMGFLQSSHHEFAPNIHRRLTEKSQLNPCERLLKALCGSR